MNDPVDRLLSERARADVGFRSGIVASFVVHVATVSAAFAAPYLFPPPPPLKVADGFAVVLPRGGGGDPNAGGAQAPPAVQTPAPADPAPPAAEPPPSVLKPPLPPDVVAWLQAFNDEHYRPEPTKRRRPVSFLPPEKREG